MHIYENSLSRHLIYTCLHMVFYQKPSLYVPTRSKKFTDMLTLNDLHTHGNQLSLRCIRSFMFIVFHQHMSSYAHVYSRHYVNTLTLYIILVYDILLTSSLYVHIYSQHYVNTTCYKYLHTRHVPGLGGTSCDT